MKNYRTKVLYWLIGFFLFFGFSEFGMAAAKPKLKLCYSTLGAGAGQVTFSPAAKVTNKCASYNSGTSVILKATPNSSSSFGSWSGCSNSTNECKVTLTANGAVVVTFNAKAKLTVVSASNKGTVTNSSSSIKCGAACSAWFSKDTLVQLSATAKSGYLFSSWTGDCSGLTCAVEMTTDKKVTAVYSATEKKVKSFTIGVQVSAIPPTK